MPFDGTLSDERVRVLTGALDLLRKYGWCQNQSTTNDGRMCMMTALREAGKLRTTEDLERIGVPWPVDFNDLSGRTFEEVEKWFGDRVAESSVP